MSPDEMRNVLEQVQAGRLSVDAALRGLTVPAVADLGYAQVDLQRRQRCGFPEVIFCEGKTPGSTSSWWSPAWTAPCPAWWAGWPTARSSPSPPASATGPPSAGWPRS